MRYDITLKIDYTYQSASDHARNLLRLLPPDIPGQQVIASRFLTIHPMPHERRDITDFFGNVMTMIAFHDPIDTISLSLRARAERLQPASPLDLSPPLDELERELHAERRLDANSPHHFIGPSPRVAPEAPMTAFARDQLRPGQTTMQVVMAIGQALHREMSFDAEATDVNTPPGEAFAQRHGVCQDFSHVMIACLRGVGIPAGYVSGFLRTAPPPGQPRLEGADAMHAWVRAWCGCENGWVEFDPTNDMMAGLDHIVVAHGRDYGDVSPVKGVMRTSGGQESKQSVDVVPLP